MASVNYVATHSRILSAARGVRQVACGDPRPYRFVATLALMSTALHAHTLDNAVR